MTPLEIIGFFVVGIGMYSFGYWWYWYSFDKDNHYFWSGKKKIREKE